MLPHNTQPMGLDLKEIDDQILDLLAEGRNVPSNLADELDVTRQYIQQRLKLLEAADYVQNIGRGVYEVIEDPRNESDTE
jgi:predicted transcriptional regulator